MASYRCQFCGTPDSVTESVTLSGWQSITNIRWEEDEQGKNRLLFDPTRDREASWDSVDGEGFHCSNCDTARPRLDELIAVTPLYECRTHQWRGIDTDEHDCPDVELIEPLPPAPGQESLDIAA